MPEVRRLLHLAAERAERRAAGVRWAHWRRAHRATARLCHVARRAARHPRADAVLPVVVVPGTPALTEAGWGRAAPLVPAGRRRGGQWRDHRQVVGGILWVMRTGAPWRELPPEFGAWQTVHGRYQRWRADGIWDAILAALRPLANDPPAG